MMPIWLLVITCPGTGEDIETGFAMSKAAFDAATLTDIPLRCPLCKSTHKWSVEDARLKDCTDESRAS
jgi:hypothetical protein